MPIIYWNLVCSLTEVSSEYPLWTSENLASEGMVLVSCPAEVEGWERYPLRAKRCVKASEKNCSRQIFFIKTRPLTNSCNFFQTFFPLSPLKLIFQLRWIHSRSKGELPMIFERIRSCWCSLTKSLRTIPLLRNLFRYRFRSTRLSQKILFSVTHPKNVRRRHRKNDVVWRKKEGVDCNLYS